MPTGAFRSAVNDHHQKKNTNKMGVPAPAGGELEKNLPYTWAHDGTCPVRGTRFKRSASMELSRVSMPHPLSRGRATHRCYGARAQEILGSSGVRGGTEGGEWMRLGGLGIVRRAPNKALE